MTFSIVTARLGSILFATLVAFTAVSAPQKATAQDPFVGEVRLFGGNFCPRNWAKADGQLQAIAQNDTLFSLYGTMYGGDGRTTFGLPDLRGRVPISNGQGPGLMLYRQGTKVGAENFTITVNQMPSHNHIVNGTNEAADKHGPGDDFLAAPYNADGTELNIYHEGPPNKQMDPGAISNTGGGQAITHRGPALAMQWCVALVGIYPSRN